MMKTLLKYFVRSIIGFTNGKTVPILAGPLKGRRLLRQHGLSQLSMLFGRYESDFATAFAKCATISRATYDVGGNTGYFSLLAANQSPEGSSVVAFEPVPSILNYFREMVAANHLDHTVRVCQVALSNTKGKVKLYTPGSSATVVLPTACQHSKQPEDTSIDVSTTTMDVFVFEEGNAPPELIKIDVEGAEAAVLQGARRVIDTYHPTILVEVHGEKPAADVWDIAKSLDYVVHDISGQHETELINQADWMDLFAGSKWTIRHCLLTSTSKTLKYAA